MGRSFENDSMTGTNTAAHIADGEPARPTVTGRFAPSPSGRMHLGNVCALMAWLSVRSRADMVLRIEDLDDRCRRGRWDALLIEDLEWLGLDWDEIYVYQSDG